MKRIHIGHHFFGAGNLGDDFMLAGFLAAIRPHRSHIALTCCVPAGHAALALRFPEIDWLPCDEPARQAAIAACDVWLGLGGSPFQCSVSRWFIDHLEKERLACATHKKPMFFLGVGGQDRAAYALPETRALCEQAERIWTRDAATAEALAETTPEAKTSAAADLAHIFFAETPPPPAAAGRLTAVLNFDYAAWPQLGSIIAGLEQNPASERVWLAQESRPLPGAERALYDALPPALRPRWNFLAADDPSAPLAKVLARWPSGEWLLSSRYHATLAGAWAGSRTVVVAINEKLRGVALEYGYPSVPPDAAPEVFLRALSDAPKPSRTRLERAANDARQACSDWAAAIGLASVLHARACDA